MHAEIFCLNVRKQTYIGSSQFRNNFELLLGNTVFIGFPKPLKTKANEDHKNTIKSIE